MESHPRGVTASNEFIFERGGSLEISVQPVDAEDIARAVLMDDTGRPLHVRLFSHTPDFSLQGGETIILGSIPPGSWLLRFVWPDGRVNETRVVIGAGRMTRITIP